MDIESFRGALDRFGSAFSAWPLPDVRNARRLLTASDEARRARGLTQRIETEIGSSRPAVGKERAQLIVTRAMIEIARREARAAAQSPFQTMLSYPLLRAACLVSLPAIGFAIGLAVGTPDLTSGKVGTDGMASAVSLDDGAF
jgi:hypothetical protein